MAEYKKSFILYADLITIVKKLVIKDRTDGTNYAGELFLHILEYVNDNEPIPIDFIIEMAFEPIKLQLKRDLKKWEANVEQRRQAGLRSAEARKTKANEKQRPLTTVQRASTNSTVNDTVNVNVNDTVTEEIKQPKVFNFKKSLLDLGVEKQIASDYLKVRSKKRASNTETAFNSIKKQIEKSPLSANESIKVAVEKSWAGFKAEWINNLSNNETYQQNTPRKDKGFDNSRFKTYEPDVKVD